MSDQPLLQHPIDYFGEIFVINLRSRPDRREEILREFARESIPPNRITWFDAVRPENAGNFESIGARGCFESHLAILERSRQSPSDSILILEDDVNFTKGFSQSLAVAVEALAASDWQVFYGGGRLADEVAGDDVILPVPAASGIGCTHFVAFRKSVVADVYDYLRLQTTRLPGDPAGGPMHVDGSYSWARREMGLNTYIANPEIAYQRSSQSDIARPGRFDAIPGWSQINAMRRGLKQWFRSIILR